MMLLIIIKGVTLLNTSYYINFAFFCKKTYEVYKCLFKYIKDFYKYFDILDLNVIFMDI